VRACGARRTSLPRDEFSVKVMRFRFTFSWTVYRDETILGVGSSSCHLPRDICCHFTRATSKPAARHVYRRVYGAGGYGPSQPVPETQIKRETETETEMTADRRAETGVSRIRPAHRQSTSVIATKTNECVEGQIMAIKHHRADPAHAIPTLE